MPKLIHFYNKETASGGGCTIAWDYASGTKGKMVEVAIRYCSPKDMYNRKIGAELALSNFDTGYTIVVPANLSRKGDSAVYQYLHDMFNYSWI